MDYFDEQSKQLEELTIGAKAQLEDKARAQELAKAESKGRNEAKRFFQAGIISPLNADWIGSLLSPNQNLKATLQQMRARSRAIYENGSTLKALVTICQQSVKPFKLSSKVTNSRKGFNAKVTTQIEESWKDFCRAGNIDVTGKYSLNDLVDQMLKQYVVDGEILCRLVRGRGKYGLQVQLLNTDQLQINNIAGKDPYSMAVECDEWGKPTTYHICPRHPMEGTNSSSLTFDASEIIHVYKPHDVGASRGVPLLHSVLGQIEMLDSYANAVLVAAKMAACTSVTYEQKVSYQDAYDGADIQQMAPGTSENALTPGMAEALPYGVEKKLLTPNQPVQSFSDFTRCIKKDISSAPGLSYNLLYSDYENTSFSSLKAAYLTDKTFIEDIQAFMIDKILDRIFEAWIDSACSIGPLRLPAVAGSYDIYKAHTFIGKGVPFIDPLKDIQAQIAALDAGLISREDIANLQGEDLEELFQRIKKGEDLAAQYGISIRNPNPTSNPAVGSPTSTPNTPEIEDSEEKDPITEETEELDKEV